MTFAKSLRHVGPWLLLGVIITVAARGPIDSVPADDTAAASGPAADGKTDDTDTIQSAVNRGGSVRLGAGVHRITRPIVIDLDKSGPTSLHGDGVATIRMEGPGPAIRVVGTHFSSADPGGFEPRVWTRQRMPLIDGIAITATHQDADGIEAVGTMQLTVSRVHIRKCRHGIRLAKNNRNVIISDCHIYENSGVGVYYDDVNLHQSNIVGSHISYNGGGGVVSRRGNVRNIHISGCDLESNMAPGEPTANVLIDCRGSAYGTAEVAITGCTIQHNHTAEDSANVRILGLSKPAAKQPHVREGNITITGNVFSDVAVNVHLQSCRGVTVVGNTFWMGYQQNLLIEKCSSVVLGANNLDRNPRYAYGDAATTSNCVVIRDSEDCTISGLHVTGVRSAPAAVAIRRCRRMNISDCTILDCDNIGLLLEDLSQSRVSGLLIRDDREASTSTAVKIIGGQDNQIDADVR